VHSEPSTAQSVLAGVPRPIGALGRRGLLIGAVRAIALAGGPLLLIGLLTWPMLFTDHGFNGDWLNHLWFSWSEGRAIRENLHPSFYLNYSHAVFYPQFAFYGGTLYAIVGTLALLLGEAPIAGYVLAYLLGFAASYGGWYWMARMAGLGRWWANAPGIVSVTSAYYLALIYERGDLPEFTAVSIIPLMVAATLSILRARRLRLRPALALSASAVVYGGSHPLTMVWGSSVLALTALLAVACIPEARRLASRSGVLRVAAMFVPAVLVSAWQLLPALAYQEHTHIGALYQEWRIVVADTEYMVTPAKIFTLSRELVKRETSELALALPILAMAWALGAGLLLARRRVRQPWGMLLLVCGAMAALMTVVMTHAGLILALPRPYTMIVFPYRLESYVTLETTGAVLAGLALAQRTGSRARHWVWVLTPALAIGIVGAARQTAAYEHGKRRQWAITEHARPRPQERGLEDYEDAHLRPLEYSSGANPPEVYFPPSAIHDEHISKIVHFAPGSLIASNIGGGPELVHVSGATIVGIMPRGDDVLQVGNSTGEANGAPGSQRAPWTEVITVSTAKSLPIIAGRVLSLAALAFLVCELLLLATTRALRTWSPGTPRSPRSRPRARSPTP
jgi:hypothetical protein